MEVQGSGLRQGGGQPCPRPCPRGVLGLPGLCVWVSGVGGLGGRVRVGKHVYRVGVQRPGGGVRGCGSGVGGGV